MPISKPRFLGLDKVKAALEVAKTENIKEIYLQGGEPLMHPDINNIIRMCLKMANVTILTNGLMLNDKKTRFLRQIEKDHDFELIFRVSLDHYIEEKNDDLRGRGSFRKALTGIENLIRNGFNPIVSAVNVWNEDEATFKSGFFNLFNKIHFEAEDINLKIIPPIKLGEFAKNYSQYDEDEIVTAELCDKMKHVQLDCSTSRVVTENGIYACPMLVNDSRGKVGNSMNDYARKFFLEPQACSTCSKNSTGTLNNNWATQN